VEDLKAARDLTLALIQAGKLSHAEAVNETFTRILQMHYEARRAVEERTRETVDEVCARYRGGTAG